MTLATPPFFLKKDLRAYIWTAPGSGSGSA